MCGKKHQLDHPMNLQILGTRGEVEESAPLHQNHSGILVDGMLLLDVGEREYLSHHPSYIVITHLHPDHAYFIIEPDEIAVPVYGPESYRDTVIVQEITDEKELGIHRVQPVPTHHSKKVRSAAMVVTDGSTKICYTGDMIWINKEFHSFLQGSDLIITDGSDIRKGGRVRKDRETGRLYGHNGVPDLIRLFRDFTDTILFVHFGSWFFKDIQASAKRLEEMGEQYGVNVILGYDGMVVNTGDL